MKVLFVTLAFVSTLFASSFFVMSDELDDDTKPKTIPFMRVKLVGSQNVLTGLVTEDFELIRRGASDMKTMSEAIQWPRSKDKVYEHYGQDFRRQCDKLMQLAKKKNLEGAHYTYLHMTTTCVNCHNYVRGSFRVKRDSTNPKGPVILIPTEWEGQTFQREHSASSDAKHQN